MPQQKHSFTGTEIKAGVMVAISAVALGVFIAVIQGVRPPQAMHAFRVYVSDVAGLNKGADVRFGGKKVGRVVDIGLDPQDRSRLRIDAAVRPDTPINEKSSAYIGQVTLMSEKHLEITTGDKDAPLLPNGAEIEFKGGGLFDQAGELAAKVQETLDNVLDLIGVAEAKDKEAKGEGELVTLEDIFQGVKTTLEEGKTLVDDVQGVIQENRGTLSDIVAKIKDIEASAQKLVDDIDGMLAENRENIRGITGSVNKTLEGVEPIVKDVADLSERLDELAASLQKILDNAESLSAEAQDLLRANRPVMEDILFDVREAVRNLKTFSRTMAEQPQAVIRGKTPEGRQ